MNIKRILTLGLLLVVMPTLSGCWLAAGAVAGAYGGYKMKEKGYTVQKPITKKTSDKKESQESQ